MNRETGVKRIYLVIWVLWVISGFFIFGSMRGNNEKLMFLYFIFCFVVPAIIYFGGQWAYRGFKEHPNVDALESKTDKDKD